MWIYFHQFILFWRIEYKSAGYAKQKCFIFAFCPSPHSLVYVRLFYNGALGFESVWILRTHDAECSHRGSLDFPPTTPWWLWYPGGALPFYRVEPRRRRRPLPLGFGPRCAQIYFSVFFSRPFSLNQADTIPKCGVHARVFFAATVPIFPRIWCDFTLNFLFSPHGFVRILPHCCSNPFVSLNATFRYSTYAQEWVQGIKRRS